MNIKKIISFVAISSLVSLQAFSQNHLSLKDVLSHQIKNQTQADLIKNKVQKKIYENEVTYSPWLTEVSTSVEMKSNITETFTGRATNVTDSMPWISKVDQRTPYGFKLSLEYYKELDKPEFQNRFQDEHVRGALSVSLYSNFLGRSSRRITSGSEKYENLIKRQVHAENCLEISSRYIEAASLELKLKIINDSIAIVRKLHKDVKRATRRGAMAITDKTSLEIDLNNLETQEILASQQYLEARLKLKEASSVQLKGVSYLTLPVPVTNIEAEIHYERIEQAKEELKNIKKQISRVGLNSGNDIKLYGGIESTKFTQNTINVDGKTDFAFMGVQAVWRFRDKGQSRERERLEVFKSIKTSEILNFEKNEKERVRNYSLDLKVLKASHDKILRVLKSTARLERKALKNFKGGNSRISEFLSTRNQIKNLKNVEINIRKDFWDKYTNYLYLTGSVEKLCKGGA